MDTSNETNQIEESNDSIKDKLSNSNRDELSNSNSPTSSTNSWVFVELKSNEKNKTDEVNKFYLNCSEEPVQELHENELGSHHSGSDSETDGISVISESDPFKTDEEETLPEDKGEETAPPIENVGSVNSSPLASTNNSIIHMVTPSNQISYIVAFSLVLLLIPLHWYLAPDIRQNDTETPNEILDGLKKDPGKNQQWNANTNDFKSEHIMINDPLTYCTKIHENTDYLYRDRSIKKCIKKVEKAKQKLKKINENLQNKISKIDVNDNQGDIEEIQLDYKAQYSKVNDKENKHEFYRKKIKYRTSAEAKNDKKYEREYKVEKNMQDEKSRSYKFEYRSHDPSENETEFNYPAKENNHTRKEGKHIDSDNENLNYKKQMEIENRLRIKEKYLKDKEEYLERKEYELKQWELQNKQNKIKSDSINIKISEKKNETSDEINDGSSEDSSEEVVVNFSTENNHSNNHKHKKDKKYSNSAEVDNKKQKVKTYKKYKDKYTQTHDDSKDGEWYTDMFEGRSKLRGNAKKSSTGKYNDDDDESRKDKKQKSFKNKDISQSNEDVKSGQWYTRLFEGRSRLRRYNNKYRFFNMDDTGFLKKSNVYSGRMRENSIYW